MNETIMIALAKELVKGLKTKSDLNAFTQALKKPTTEAALNAELTEHFIAYMCCSNFLSRL